MFRILDILFSLLLLAVAALPILVVALAIWLGDRGPVIFRQVRVGLGGRSFTILKFRSMRVDRDGIGAGRAAEGAGSEAKQQARARFQTTAEGDPRITPVGRVIRKAHLDELPQLFNVLGGDMSLVGVRPDTPAQEADYNPEYWVERHRFRPGITGLAQIRMGSHGTLEQRCAHELEWNRKRSVRLYLAILFGTVAKVARRDSF